MVDKKMGTLAWAKGSGSGGVLRGPEKLGLFRNLAFVQIREAFDTLRSKIGLLKPQSHSLDELLPNQSSLVTDSSALAQETHSDSLLFHSWRTYFLGRLIAKQEELDHDAEVFFASAILHDIALTETHPIPVSACCFAISGAERARDHLCDKGHNKDIADRVGNAIAMHLNMYISRRKSASEAYLVSRGAVCDLFGFGRRRVATKSLENLFQRYPRDGVIEALRFETAEHLPGSRPAILTGLSGGKAPRTPFFDALK